MDMFAVDDDITHWKAALPSLRGTDRLPVLMALAWHLRQRETDHAIALADDALAALAHTGDADMAPAARASAITRMHLVHAQAQWLAGDLDTARDQATPLIERFRVAGDHAGCADVHWLLAWIAADAGEHATRDAQLGAVRDAAARADDRLRAQLADAACARWAVLSDRNAAVARWGPALRLENARWHPALATWVHDFHALAAIGAADFGGAAGHFIRCHECALATGQIRTAITAALNMGENFSVLNDHDSALEWMQRALEIARPTGWPRSIGLCLLYTAETLRRLGQLDAARTMLHEALATLKSLEGGRSHAMALQYLGDLALDQADYPAAHAAFCQLEMRADALHQSDLRSPARRGQAHALLRMGRVDDALGAAAEAVAIAARQRQALHHIAALRVMAMIYADHANAHGLPTPAGMVEPNPALHYLHQALAVAATIDGYTAPGELHDAMAREYAQAGQHARAYETALLAAAAHEQARSTEATNRAIAMQVHHRTEHARNEGEHHRQLAAAEARRAEVLQRTSATLERLSAIGQEITTHLDAATVFRTLDRHIHGLLPATTFAIYLLDRAGALLQMAFGVEMGEALPALALAIDDASAYPARCLRERREIYIAHWPDAPHAAAGTDAHGAAGAIDKLSALFVPLVVGERAIGVMTVQAPQSRAYGENERLVFRTLCAYGAIALDNADAYRKLQDAQAQLVSQEKLAALGALMAGVAHELNTPIGNSLLIASTMQQKSAEIEALMKGPGLRRSELAVFVADAQKGAALVMRGLTSAADLVNSFKQVAVDRTTEQRRQFNLQQVCHEIVATMMNRVRAANHTLALDVDEMIAMDSYPGPFGQVIANFINNALLHAFTPGRPGRMTLTAATPVDGRVLIAFSDDGAGIPPEHLGRIFDPFFTTKLGQGGSGLGLSISYNIVTSLLGGTITVEACPGGGTCFTLDLPLCAPAHVAAGGAGIY
jgi:signal transduction histidine kinase